MSFMVSCSTYQSEQKPNIDNLIIKSLPTFPKPHEDVIQELKDACPDNKCIALHNWLWKLIILEKQLALYKIEQ